MQRKLLYSQAALNKIKNIPRYNAYNKDYLLRTYKFDVSADLSAPFFVNEMPMVIAQTRQYILRTARVTDQFFSKIFTYQDKF